MCRSVIAGLFGVCLGGCALGTNYLGPPLRPIGDSGSPEQTQSEQPDAGWSDASDAAQAPVDPVWTFDGGGCSRYTPDLADGGCCPLHVTDMSGECAVQKPDPSVCNGNGDGGPTCTTGDVNPLWSSLAYAANALAASGASEWSPICGNLLDGSSASAQAAEVCQVQCDGHWANGDAAPSCIQAAGYEQCVVAATRYRAAGDIAAQCARLYGFDLN